MSVRVDIEELEQISSFPYITVLLTGELCLRSKTPKYKGKKEMVFSYFPKSDFLKFHYVAIATS
jgi:hypothetical protein